MTANEQLQQWVDLADAATEGPWRHEADDSPFDVPITTGELDYLCTSPDDGVRGGHSIEDAAFIVASRTAVPKMAAALQAVLAMLAIEHEDEDNPTGSQFDRDSAFGFNLALSVVQRAINDALGVKS